MGEGCQVLHVGEPLVMGNEGVSPRLHRVMVISLRFLPQPSSSGLFCRAGLRKNVAFELF